MSDDLTDAERDKAVADLDGEHGEWWRNEPAKAAIRERALRIRLLSELDELVREEEPEPRALVEAVHEGAEQRRAAQNRVRDRMELRGFPDASIPTFRDSDVMIQAAQTEWVIDSVERILERQTTVTLAELVAGMRYPHGGLHPDFIQAVLNLCVDEGKLVRCGPTQHEWYEAPQK